MTLVALPDEHKRTLVADALHAKIATLPAALTRTMTWGQGHEMAQHLRFTRATRVEDVEVLVSVPTGTSDIKELSPAGDSGGRR